MAINVEQVRTRLSALGTVDRAIDSGVDFQIAIVDINFTSNATLSAIHAVLSEENVYAVYPNVASARIDMHSFKGVFYKQQ